MAVFPPFVAVCEFVAKVEKIVYVAFFSYLCSVKKTLLYEISIIRPLIIFLLVVYHTLCVFTGGWVPPEGVPENSLYWWLGHLISGFRIETIAFVGGYVFCFQSVELGKRKNFPAFVWKKFKRLIIPCFVFGIVYFLLYRFNPQHFSWNVAFWRVANGIGHLWFLPMLFWCFLASWLIDRLLKWLSERHPSYYHPVGWLLLVALAGVSLLRITGLKMGLSRAPYFIFYFYLGYWLRAVGARWREDCRTVSHGWLIAILWIAYFVFVVLHQQVTHNYLPGCDFRCPRPLQGWSQLAVRLLSLGHTLCGILAVYVSVMCWLGRHKAADAQPGPALKECSRLCYGVYVLHMFFMQYLYFYSPLPQWCCASGAGVWLMPWLVLALTLVPSVFVTWLLLKTRFGRMLIG